MKLGIIYARARNGVIGKDNQMPWHLPEDLAHFRQTTLGAPVIMGRKTWDSLPAKFRPLPGRRNVVITRQPEWQSEGAERAATLEEAIALCGDVPAAWVTGGSEIYQLALPLASTVVVTEIDADFEGDAYAPQLGPQWREVARERHVSKTGLGYSFVTLHNNDSQDEHMSGGTFHVHGPHDHELEHAQQHAAAGHREPARHGIAGGSMTSQIALFTALIATVGAIFAYMGGATQANAGLYKNNAAIKKTEASNQWNYFQAKSTKQSLAEISRDLAPPGKQANYQAKIERYEKEKKDIQAQAEKIEAESKDWDQQSDAQMHLHHRWAQATTALQVSIALAAIALLTRKKWLEMGMFAMGAVGLGIGVLAMLHV